MKDQKIEKLIELEKQRQNNHIELIASENFVSKEVMAAAGSVLTNKYAEGYPGKRYYDGCDYIDQIETLAIERVKKLFGVKFANVQPHSGSQANAAAISALVKPGGKIMGMALDAGGHLSHGYKITFSGTFFKSATYGVDQNGMIDYKEVEKIALKEKPDLIIAGFSAYSRIFDFTKFRKIADKVGAYLLADIAHIAGLVATNLHPSPVGSAHIITTTTHKTLRGARGGVIMTDDPEIAKKMNRWVFPGFQGGPLEHIIAAKAVSFNEALQPSFLEYSKNIIKNSKAFANEFLSLGVEIVSGGTDNHLFTINVKKAYNISGKAASTLLNQNYITVNKNTIPDDPLSPMIASGIRLGTAAMTTRGMNQGDFRELARIINLLLSKKVSSIKKEVKEMTSKLAKVDV